MKMNGVEQTGSLSDMRMSLYIGLNIENKRQLTKTRST